MDKHGVPPTKRLFLIIESLSLTLFPEFNCPWGKFGDPGQPKMVCPLQSSVLQTMTINLEILPIWLRKFNSTIRKNLGDGKRSRPTGF